MIDYSGDQLKWKIMYSSLHLTSTLSYLVQQSNYSRPVQTPTSFEIQKAGVHTVRLNEILNRTWIFLPNKCEHWQTVLCPLKIDLLCFYLLLMKQQRSVPIQRPLAVNKVVADFEPDPLHDWLIYSSSHKTELYHYLCVKEKLVHIDLNPYRKEWY